MLCVLTNKPKSNGNADLFAPTPGSNTEVDLFNATAEKIERYVERNKEPTEETYCPDDKEERKVRTVYKCPYS